MIAWLVGVECKFNIMAEDLLWQHKFPYHLFIVLQYVPEGTAIPSFFLSNKRSFKVSCTECYLSNVLQIDCVQLFRESLSQKSTNAYITMLKGTMGNASLNFTMLKHGRLITITNQVQSLNCKLQTEFFPLQFMAQVQNTWATTQRGKNKNP